MPFLRLQITRCPTNQEHFLFGSLSSPCKCRFLFSGSATSPNPAKGRLHSATSTAPSTVGSKLRATSRAVTGVLSVTPYQRSEHRVSLPGAQSERLARRVVVPGLGKREISLARVRHALALGIHAASLGSLLQRTSKKRSPSPTGDQVKDCRCV